MAMMSTSDATAEGEYVNDAYGALTQTAGTAIWRVVPPRAGQRAKVSAVHYIPGATAHTLSMLVCFQEIKATSEAATGQAVVVVNEIPTAGDGSLLAANDWLVIEDEVGDYGAHMVSSLSGLQVTVSANFSVKIPKGARVFFMGAPADHSRRQYTIPASTPVQYTGDGSRTVLASAALNNQPILVHSNNVTNAGTLHWLAYSYGPP